MLGFLLRDSKRHERKFERCPKNSEDVPKNTEDVPKNSENVPKISEDVPKISDRRIFSPVAIFSLTGTPSPQLLTLVTKKMKTRT